MFSSGISSWAAAKRYTEEHGADGVVLLFADTMIEDPDNYRFLDEAAANIGGELVILRDGRTPFECMRDSRIIGNSMFDPCSRLLKRKLLHKWEKDHCEPETPRIFGIDWTETHRLDRMKKHSPEKNYMAPLLSPPYLTKEDLLKWATIEGLEPPSLYKLGFPHSNCGGFCIKAGHATFRLLLKNFPERYKEAEEWELEMQEYLETDSTIMKDRSGGETKKLTMRDFRLRLEKDWNSCDEFDFGGCACALPD